MSVSVSPGRTRVSQHPCLLGAPKVAQSASFSPDFTHKAENKPVPDRSPGTVSFESPA